jgi:hypothetical protein
LKWRYEKNPLQEYEVSVTSKFYLAAYIKKRKGIKELRIVECIYLNDGVDAEIKKSIYNWCSKFGAQVISFSPILNKLKLPSVRGEFGPLATVRNLNLNKSEKEICFTTKTWAYSLGDLELF